MFCTSLRADFGFRGRDAQEGVLFMTYRSLISETKRKVRDTAFPSCAPACLFAAETAPFLAAPQLITVHAANIDHPHAWWP